MEYPSKLVENAVKEISRLPGIGEKTALRLVLHLLKKPISDSASLSQSIIDLRENIKYCNICHIISDTSDCTCKGISVDRETICVVEDTPDVIAIRKTGQYQGMYHVLGGRISPVDGIGPEDIKIDSLIRRVEAGQQELKEIVLALSGTMEGETTAFYITKVLAPYDVKITSIARGIPVGGELEYADEVTLGRSISSRTLFQDS